jgi:hypothetical protein
MKRGRVLERGPLRWLGFRRFVKSRSPGPSKPGATASFCFIDNRCIHVPVVANLDSTLIFNERTPLSGAIKPQIIVIWCLIGFH